MVSSDSVAYSQLPFMIKKIDGKHTLCVCSRMDYLDCEHYMNQFWDAKYVSRLCVSLVSLMIFKTRFYSICFFPHAGEDFNIIQQEIAILSECKNPNIVGYSGSYLR